MTIEIAIFTAVLLGVLGGLFLERFRTYFEVIEQQKHIASGGERALAKPRHDRQLPALPRSPAAQLQQVTEARFAQRRLLNSNEDQIFQALEVATHDLDLGWRVMAQVNLAEIVASNNPDALAAIADQRVAMLIVSAAQMPLAAIEYQALDQIRDEDLLRAAVKREALRHADIDYIEIRPDDTSETVRDHLHRLAARLAAAAQMTNAAAPDTPLATQPSAGDPRPAARKPRGRAAPGV